MFNLLDINCKFKSRIQKFGQELKLKNLQRKELENKNSILKNKLNNYFNQTAIS
jgi:hypothetical protein